VVLFPAMIDPANTSTPQFGTAEYLGAPTADSCHFCKQPVSLQYYRVGGAISCGTCAEIARQQTPQDSHSAYSRALLFGIGAAVVGLVGYATLVIILQGWTIGYISLGVGYIVGRAMMLGSKGLGGRRYQIAAALLTYAAVSMAEIPIQLVLFSKHQPTQQEVAQQEQRQFEKENGQQPSTLPGRAQEPEQPREPKSFWSAIGYLALLGLASPFYALADNQLWGVIGLVILFVGIKIAWKITAGRPSIEVFGPFNATTPA